MDLPVIASASGSRWRLGFAATAVLLAAADTYVVVLALPSIMGDVGIPLDQLQRAAPIVSGFLLGYIVMLPLLGRLSDVYGRRPVFAGCLLAFALGSIVTAGADNLATVTVGRTLQGLGGGGLVPVTLAIVADLWPEGRRGLPLGIVGAVQELGSVIGPLYGALVITVSSWRTIFWVNVPLVALLGVAFVRAGAESAPLTSAHQAERVGRRDVVGACLLVVAAGAGLLAYLAPTPVTSNLLVGQLYQPLIGTSGATTAIAIATYIAGLFFVAWEAMEPLGVRPLVPLRHIATVWDHADWGGALLLAGVLGSIVLSFSSADPSRQIIADNSRILLPGAALLAAAFIWHERNATDPLIAFGEFRDRAAVGSLLVNLVLGAALMAAIIDVPIFARATAFPDSQINAALILVRLLAAVPVGALIGGLVCERIGYRAVTAVGMTFSALALLGMAQWNETTLVVAGVLGTPVRMSDGVLALCGLGFGIAIAPVNAAMLAATAARLHGLASALVVVARMIGMLVGLSVLTALGLRTFAEAQTKIPSPTVLCPHSPANCSPYDILVRHAIVEEIHVIFIGAACCAALAAILGGALLRRPTHGPTAVARD